MKPHRTEGCKVSNTPPFKEKVTDIVGLDLETPDRAVMLCVDGESPIRALDRTRPGLPLMKGRAATMTHDYGRYGTTTLFAAPDVTSSMVIGDGMPRRPRPCHDMRPHPGPDPAGRAGSLSIPSCAAAGSGFSARAIRSSHLPR